MTRPKVTIIGNSHCATLKKALDQNPYLSDEFDITFFVAGGTLHYEFYLDGDLTFRLRDEFAATPKIGRYLSAMNGTDRINLRHAENVFYVGRHFGEFEAAQLSLTYDVDQIAIGTRPQRLSKLAFDRFCKDLALSFLPPGRWLQPLPFHLTLAMGPYPASSLAKAEDFHNAALRWKPIAEDPRTLRPICKAYESTLAAVSANYGIAFLTQPESTLDSNGLTLPEFVRQRTDSGKDGTTEFDDYRHMNADYGLRTLNAYFESIRLRATSE